MPLHGLACGDGRAGHAEEFFCRRSNWDYYAAMRVRHGRHSNSIDVERRPGPVWKHSALLIAVVAALATPAKAQGHTGGAPSAAAPTMAPNGPSANPADDAIGTYVSSHAGQPPESAQDSALDSTEACTTLTEEGIHSPSVSAARLAVPGAASGEYRKACGALIGRKLDKAEEHVRKALVIYPNYAAAWVVLGQVLQAQQKPADARQACSQAMQVDSAYLPPYLCLADFAAREGDWNQVTALADRARSLDPDSAYVLFFTAGSQFRARQLREAQASAEAGVKLDLQHQVPELRYLLARIFQAEGDLADEAIQLREYLKAAPDAANAPAAKAVLAQLDAKSPK
jgi:Tfp pilus assembly protein PilF